MMDSWNGGEKKDKGLRRWWICRHFNLMIVLWSRERERGERMLYLRRSLSPLMAASYESVAISSSSYLRTKKKKRVKKSKIRDSKRSINLKQGIWFKWSNDDYYELWDLKREREREDLKVSKSRGGFWRLKSLSKNVKSVNASKYAFVMKNGYL